MKKILATRGCGKTYELIERAIACPDKAVILTSTIQSEKMIKNILSKKKINVNKVSVMRFSDVINNSHKIRGTRSLEMDRFFIDDCDYLLRMFLHNIKNIDTITMNIENEDIVCVKGIKIK